MDVLVETVCECSRVHLLYGQGGARLPPPEIQL